jgi:hypothetical protein
MSKTELHTLTDEKYRELIGYRDMLSQISNIVYEWCVTEDTTTYEAVCNMYQDLVTTQKLVQGLLKRVMVNT